MEWRFNCNWIRYNCWISDPDIPRCFNVIRKFESRADFTEIHFDCPSKMQFDNPAVFSFFLSKFLLEPFENRLCDIIWYNLKLLASLKRLFNLYVIISASIQQPNPFAFRINSYHLIKVVDEPVHYLGDLIQFYDLPYYFLAEFKTFEQLRKSRSSSWTVCRHFHFDWILLVFPESYCLQISYQKRGQPLPKGLPKQTRTLLKIDHPGIKLKK